jgi:hypothetical protein
MYSLASRFGVGAQLVRGGPEIVFELLELFSVHGRRS